MSESFAHSPDSLGTTGLLSDLDGVQRCLVTLNASNPETEVANLLEQIEDLLDVTASLNSLATKERRSPSVYPGAHSASDLIHLQSVVSGATTITEECSVFSRALESSLNAIARERDTIGYVTSENQLGNQAWYHETYEALKLRTEILRILLSAIDLLHRKNDRDQEDNLSAETRSLASTLHYQITLIRPKLSCAHDRSIHEVCSDFKRTTITLMHSLVTKSCSGC